MTTIARCPEFNLCLSEARELPPDPEQPAGALWGVVVEPKPLFALDGPTGPFWFPEQVDARRAVGEAVRDGKDADEVLRLVREKAMASR
jgi:hypothetical protein